MPIAKRGSVSLRYALSGRAGGEAVVLLNSLGADLRMWDKALPSLETRFRVLRCDTRGHGGSSPWATPLTIADLGRDVLFLLDELELDRVHLCGISLGGLTAMWLGIHAGERVERMVLANTTARIGTAEAWEQRIAAVQAEGMGPLAASAPSRWFTRSYAEQHAGEMQLIRAMVGGTDAASYAACCGVLRDTDLRGEVQAIAAPCLIVAGTHDAATPPAEARALHGVLRDAKYVELDCSHLSAWERAEEFSRAVLAFLPEGAGGDG